MTELESIFSTLLLGNLYNYDLRMKVHFWVDHATWQTISSQVSMWNLEWFLKSIIIKAQNQIMRPFPKIEVLTPPKQNFLELADVRANAEEKREYLKIHFLHPLPCPKLHTLGLTPMKILPSAHYPLSLLSHEKQQLTTEPFASPCKSLQHPQLLQLYPCKL